MTEPMKSARQSATDRVATRAWRDPAFRTLLLAEPAEALRLELGEVPEGMEHVRFRRCDVDRAVVRHTPLGRRLVIRPKRADTPLSIVTREVFGVPELVVVFYTRRCQYQCSFCTLPSTSAYSDVSFDDVARQLDHGFAQVAASLATIERISIGNEGSILDARTLPVDQLEHVLKRCGALPAVREIVLETRSEFVTASLLDTILRWVAPCRLVLKIGLESADRRIREDILHKRMDLAAFEAVVALLGPRRIGLASYVLVKADPAHSDAEGRADAIATCAYLKRLCAAHGVALTLRVNSMYKARGSVWARAAEKAGWRPPSIVDLARVMLAVEQDGVEVFAGLYDEGLAAEDGHYEARPDFEPWALDTLERYNQTGDTALIRRVAERSGTVEVRHGAF